MHKEEEASVPYVIVMVGGQCEHYEGHDCVLWVRGPYANRDEGRAAFEEELRLGERPHWMSVDPTPPEDAKKGPGLPWGEAGA